MNIEELQSICMSFKGATEDIKWGEHLCFNVGGKMFMITSPDRFPVNASFKTSDEDFDLLTSQEGFKPSPYMARYKWVHVEDISRLSKKQWEQYARMSYEIIAAKLPKKLKSEIGITIPE